MIKFDQTRAHTEGESNTSAARAEWLAKENDAAARALIQREADGFMHQNVATPVVSTIAKAEGIWIETVAGHRYMDFHGNSAHHIGYSHPRLKAAIKT